MQVRKKNLVSCTTLTSEILSPSCDNIITATVQRVVTFYYKNLDLPKRKHETVAVNILDAIIKIACSNTKELFIADPTVIANI